MGDRPVRGPNRNETKRKPTRAERREGVVADAARNRRPPGRRRDVRPSVRSARVHPQKSVGRLSSACKTREEEGRQRDGPNSQGGGPSAPVMTWPSEGVEIWPSARVETWPSGGVEIWPSARVETWPSARVETWPSARVETWPSARVEIWPSARVEIWPSARVEIWPSARVEICGPGGGRPTKRGTDDPRARAHRRIGRPSRTHAHPPQRRTTLANARAPTAEMGRRSLSRARTGRGGGHTSNVLVLLAPVQWGLWSPQRMRPLSVVARARSSSLLTLRGDAALNLPPVV